MQLIKLEPLCRRYNRGFISFSSFHLIVVLLTWFGTLFLFSHFTAVQSIQLGINFPFFISSYLCSADVIWDTISFFPFYRRAVDMIGDSFHFISLISSYLCSADVMWDTISFFPVYRRAVDIIGDKTRTPLWITRLKRGPLMDWLMCQAFLNHCNQRLFFIIVIRDFSVWLSSNDYHYYPYK